MEIIRRPTKKQMETLLLWCRTHRRDLPADVLETYAT